MSKRASLHGTAQQALAEAGIPIETPPAATESAGLQEPTPELEVEAAIAVHPAVPRARKSARKPGASAATAGAIAGAAWFRDATPLYQELLDFAQNRLRRNLEAGVAISRCTGPKELMEAQAAYWREASEQYMAEYFKVMDLVAKTIGSVTLAGRKSSE